MRINAHGHLLPYSHEIPAFMKEKQLFWIEDSTNSMCQGMWRRPITHASFFLKEKIAWMDKNNIDKEVILNLSQLYCNGWNKKDTRDVIQFQNDFNAKLQVEYPERFISGFVLQAQYLDDAIHEMERCVEKLNMPILCLPTHFLLKDKWTSIFNDYTAPLFEMANHYNLALQIHPYNAEEMILLDDQYWRFHLIWMCAQTADAYHIYSMQNFVDKYPQIRTCFAHGNQFGQIGYGRRLQGYKGRPDLFENAANPIYEFENNNVYFDTIVHDVLSFGLLVQRSGVNKIVAGLDDPYPLGEMENVPGCYPGKVIDEAVSHGIITNMDRTNIWYHNVLKWIYPEN